MKKVLTVVAVALLATTTLFAGVSFGGKFQGGYNLNWNDGTFTAQDFEAGSPTVGEKALDGRLNLTAKDDNGLWSMNIDGATGAFNTNKSANIDLTLNADKIVKAAFDKTLPVSLQVRVGFDDRQVGQRVYANKSGLSFDRIRTASADTTADGGKSQSFVGTTIGYKSYVTASADYSPALKSGIFGVKSAPVDGIKVAANYAINGQLSSSLLTKNTADNLASAAADVNVGKLADLDFDLGVSAAYAYVQESGSQIASTVYGGVKEVSGYAEVVVALPEEGDTQIGVFAGADLAVVENLSLSAYFGMNNVSDAENFTVGGTIGYNLAGIGLNLNVEYNNKDTSTASNTGVGFNLTPYVVVAF